MKFPYTCSHCGGKKVVDDKVCYVCAGKGRIELSPEELDSFFARFRESQPRE